MPGDGIDSISRSESLGGQSDLLGQLAAGRRLGRLTGDVAHPGRDLHDLPFVGRPVLPTSTTDGLPSASNTSGTTATAPGDRTMSRWNGSPSGLSKSATTTRQTWPWWTSRSPSRRKPSPRDAGSVDVSGDDGVAAALGAELERGADELAEQRMRAVGPALELGVGLGADPERVVGELDELDQPAVGRRAAADEPVRLEAGPVVGVELVAVTVPLADDRLAVGLGHLGARLEHGVVRAQAHRAALVGHVALVVHQVDHRVLGRRVELGRVGVGQTEHVAGELDRHRLQPEAQPEAGHALLAGVAGGGDLALDAAGTEAAGDDDAVEVGEAPGGQQPLDVLGLDPVDLDLGAVVEPGVLEALDHRQVGVGELHVLADQPMRTGVGGRLDEVDDRLPRAQVQLRRRVLDAAAPRRRRRRGPRRGGSAAARRCCGRRRR